VETGVWIERFLPDCSGLAGAPPGAVSSATAQTGRPGRRGSAPTPGPRPPSTGLPAGFPPGYPGTAPTTPATPAGLVVGTNEVGCAAITIVCRAVDIGKPGANDRFAYMVDEALRNQQMFVPTNMLRGELRPEGATFTFELHVTLKQPLIL
jgi:hypothetical protein